MNVFANGESGLAATSVVDHDIGTRLGKSDCDGRPDTPRGTRDKSPAALEAERRCHGAYESLSLHHLLTTASAGFPWIVNPVSPSGFW